MSVVPNLYESPSILCANNTEFNNLQGQLLEGIGLVCDSEITGIWNPLINCSANSKTGFTQLYDHLSWIQSVTALSMRTSNIIEVEIITATESIEPNTTQGGIL